MDNAEMDGIHEIGSEPWWREAWFFDFYDPTTSVALKSYAGVCPNQERADLVFYLALDGRPVHRVLKTDYRISKTVGEERLSFGPQLLEMIEPNQAWRLRYDAGNIAADVRFDAVHPVFSWAEGKLSMEESAAAPSKHTDQVGRYTGWVQVDDRRLQIDGAIGMRDRMWGWGDRSKWKNYMILWAPFSDDFAVNVACQQFSDGRNEVAGYIHLDGRRSILERAELEVDWDPERWKTMRSVRSTLVDREGRSVEMVSRPDLVIDTGGQWPHRVDHMLFATGLHRADGHEVNSIVNWAFLTYNERPSTFSVDRRTGAETGAR